MDKDLVNNQIVSMRKNVRNCKRFVKQRLIKQIKTLEQRLNKSEKPNPKLKNKIINKRNELIAINGVNVDEVSKQALIKTKEYFEDVIRSPQSSAESKALARIASTELVGKVVTRFKDDNPNCEQWLPSQIELWEQKKALKRNKIKNKKVPIEEEMNTNSEKPKVFKEETVGNKVSSKTSKTDKKLKRNEEIEIKKNVKEVIEKVEQIEENKPKSDPFFLSNDSNLSEDQSDANSDQQEQTHTSRQTSRTRNASEDKQPKKMKFGKTVGKNYRKPIQGKKQSFKSNNKSEQKPMPKDKSPKSVTKGKEENLHPSWAAKRSAKDKLKIDVNQKPMAKKIKFE